MYNIAVIGDMDSVAGFGSLGMETYFADEQEKVKKVFKQLVLSGSYGIIYITEKAASLICEDIEKQERELVPAVIQIPGVSGNTGAGIRGVKKSVEIAVGSDIIFNN